MNKDSGVGGELARLPGCGRGPTSNISAIWGVIDIALSLILRFSQQITGSRAFPDRTPLRASELPLLSPFFSPASPPLSCLLATSHLSFTSSVFVSFFTSYFRAICSFHSCLFIFPFTFGDLLLLEMSSSYMLPWTDMAKREKTKEGK